MKKCFLLLLPFVLLCCMTACGQAKTNPDTNTSPSEIVLHDVMQEILDNTQLPEMMELTDENLADYYGLDAAWYTDAAACINANGYEKEEIVLVHAKTEADVPQIEQCLNTALSNAAEEMRNYLPQQYAMIQNSRVQTKGLYVWLFISEDNDGMQQILDRRL